MKKEKEDILELLKLDSDMEIMRQWQLLNLLIEIVEAKRVDRKKKEVTTKDKKEEKKLATA